MPILVLLIIGVHTANGTHELLNDDSSAPPGLTTTELDVC